MGYKTITFSSASSCASVLDELWPFKCLKVTVNSIKSDTISQSQNYLKMDHQY